MRRTELRPRRRLPAPTVLETGNPTGDTAIVLVTRIGETRGAPIPPGARVEACEGCKRPVWLCRESLEATRGLEPFLICTACEAALRARGRAIRPGI